MVHQTETVIPLLEKLGISAASPELRSSMFKVAVSNPFAFYLFHRLQLTSKLSWSQALSHGSWAHKAAELILQTDEPFGAYSRAIEVRLKELEAICKNVGILPTGIEPILHREELDAYTAWAWMRASRESQVDWLHFAKKSHFEVVAIEPDLHFKHPTINYRVGIKPDIILYHKAHNTIWLGDYKTTGKSPTVRAVYCPRDFQTQLYLDVAQQLSDTTGLCGLPKGLQVKGMAHIIIEKPNIEFGQNDRDFSIKDFTPSRGPNKGITRQEKEYFGDPKLANYVRRCANWYAWRDDYAHLAQTREEPPVNISYSPTTKVLDFNGLHCYHSRLKYLHDLLTRPAFPLNFIYNPNPPAFGNNDVVADFANFDVMEWPSLMSRHRLMTRLQTDTISLKESLSD